MSDHPGKTQINEKCFIILKAEKKQKSIFCLHMIYSSGFCSIFMTEI